MATTVYDALVRFVGDLTDVDKSLAGIQTKAAQAGTTSGQSFGDKFGGVIKTTIGALAGAGIGLLLKAVTDGAVELDAATRKYQADTGATMEQTKLAGEQINALFETNTEGYTVIGAVLGKLATDLHITGTTAQAAAQSFLNYAKATGQEPVAATDALTTAIKAWQIPAAQIPGLMDQIVAGHQKYGGSVNDNVAALAKLAPALQAANFTVDDATGLLNLFAASGLDASKASLAFQTALTKVKSPAELDKLIAQIQSTPDDFTRAQLAIQLFGTRAGAQLATALAPGSKSIADYVITVTEAQNASTDAADAIDQGIGNQVVMAFHKVEGALSGFAQNAQPVIDVLDALGNMGINVLPALTGVLGGLVAKILPVAKATGQGAGVAMGTGIAEGVAESEPAIDAAVGTAAASAVPAAEAGGTALGTAVGGAFAIAAPIALVAGFLLISKEILDWASSQNEVIQNGVPGHMEMKGKWEVWVADAVTAGTDAGTGSADALGSSMEVHLGKTLDDVGMSIATAFSGYARTAATTAAEMMASFQSMAAAWAAQWSELDSIATAAADDIYGATIRGESAAANAREQAAERAIIASKKSTKQEVADAKDRLTALQQEGLGIQIEMAGRGELSNKAYAALITTLDNQAKSSNEQVANAAKLALAELAKLKTAADDTAAALAQVKVYGGNGTTKKNAAGGYLAAGETSLVNELGQELFAPTGSYFTAPMDGYVIPAGPSAAIMAGAGSGPAAAGGRQAPYIGEQHIYGIQPDEVEVQTKRAIRRATLETQLAGGRA